MTGILLQGSGNYRIGFAADAIEYAMAAIIVLALGRALAPQRVTVLHLEETSP